ncbi:hypothetical protein EJ06DRAFT_553169 [Trichodelitschia bisporula]|uniref:RING-type domain-containing protein n=1 Tax=Trichodelitschia bisporula TaxID=703511 RepID=A0A6G1I8E1_9PEZI|nr:hypothetical protein EJ06DRAFT_553169 [Trichodelitschia bisporula]
MDEPEDMDMSTSTTFPAQNHDRQVQVNTVEAMDGVAHNPSSDSAAETVAPPADPSLNEPLNTDIAAEDIMDTTPDGSPAPVPPLDPEEVQLNAPLPPAQATNPPPVPAADPTDETAVPQPSQAEIVVVEAEEAQPLSTPASPRAGTPAADDGGEDSDSEEEEEERVWQEIIEDTSVPDEQELKEMAETGATDVSALEHAYWESKTFTPLTDPESRPGPSGRIDWEIKYNGTKEKPNKDLVMKSPVTRIGGYDWQIKFYPRGNDSDYLSVYVECLTVAPPPKKDEPTSKSKRKGRKGEEPKTEEPKAETPPLPSQPEGPVEYQHTPIPMINGVPVPKRRSVAAQVSVILYNPLEPRVGHYRTCLHRFCENSPDWGWTRFHGPYYEIQHRHRGQLMALLRNDTLAFTSYIRVVEDDTNCLWEHPSRENPWNCLAMTGLRGLTSDLRPQSGGNLVSAVSTWMLLKPFRQLLYEAVAPDRVRDRRTKPKPLLAAFQKIIYGMRQPSDFDTKTTVPLDDIFEAFEWYGIDKHIDKMDVIEVWEVLRAKLEQELQDTPLANRLNELFGPAKDRTVNKPSYKAPVRGCESVQQAVEKAQDLVDSTHELPHVLQIELERQQFDEKARSWKKLADMLKLDDHIQLKDTWYTLYGFIVHKDNLQSGVYNSVLRPNGPRSKWYTFKNGRDDNQVVCLTKSQAIEAHEGIAPGKPMVETAPVAYVVSYIRDDIAEHAFDNESEPVWDVPEWIVEKFAKMSDSDIPLFHSIFGAYYESQIKQHKGPVELQVIDPRAFKEHEGPGLIDYYDPKWASSPHVFNITVPADAQRLEIRDHIAKARGISKPRRCVLILEKKTGNFLFPSFTPFTPAYVDVQVTAGELVLHGFNRLMLYVLDEADLPPPPPPMIPPPPMQVLPPAPPPALDPPPVAATPPAPPPGEDVPMTGAEDPVPVQDSIPPVPVQDGIPPVPAPVDTEMGGVTETPTPVEVPTPLQEPAAVEDVPPTMIPPPIPPMPVPTLGGFIPSPPQLDLSIPPPPPPAAIPARAEDIIFFLKVFKPATQQLVHKGTYMARKSARIDHTVNKLLSSGKDTALQLWEENATDAAHSLRRRKTFADEELRCGAIIIVQPQMPDEIANELRERGLHTDITHFLRARSDLRNFPNWCSGRFILDYFSTERYEGDMVARQAHGIGHRVYHNGNSYRGSFVLGERQGDGVMVYANGDVYEGTWERGMQHGQGQYVEASTGNKYEGGWRHDKRHGEGVTTWKVAQETERLCRICWDEGAEAAFYDCGHVVACLGCAKRMDQCPVCRKRVLSVMKLFYVS